MKWTDAEDIGIALVEKFPGVDPLTVRFTDLREKVVGLDGFDDDPKMSNEPKLEAIQMAWYEEFKDAQVALSTATIAIEPGHLPPGHARLFRAADRGRRAHRERVSAVGHRRRRRRLPVCPTSRRCGSPASARSPRCSRCSA